MHITRIDLNHITLVAASGDEKFSDRAWGPALTGHVDEAAPGRAADHGGGHRVVRIDPGLTGAELVEVPLPLLACDEEECLCRGSQIGAT